MGMKILKTGICICRREPPFSVGLECFVAGRHYKYAYCMRRGKDKDILVYRVYPSDTGDPTSFSPEYETIGVASFDDFFKILESKLVSIFKMHPHELHRMIPKDKDTRPNEPALVAMPPCSVTKDRVIVYREEGNGYDVLFTSTLDKIFDLRKEANGDA